LQSEIYIQDVIERFRQYKDLGEKAMVQVNDAGFFAMLDEESNSIGIIVKHIAGNQRSRWTDFLTGDGEKPDRHRDTEFEIYDTDSRMELMKRWEYGWSLTLKTIESLTPADLDKTIKIRGETHTVIGAINRQLGHYAYHVGQIILLARHYATSDWQSLSVPRGQSETYNSRMFGNRPGEGK
jgi:hypothetical protein